MSQTMLEADPVGVVAASRRKPRRRPLRGRTAGTLTTLLVLIMVGLPLGYLFYGSVRSADPGTPGSTFTAVNWSAVYLHGEYNTELLHTVVLSLTVAVLSVAIGTVLAWIIARTDVPFRSALTLLLALPIMISPLITSLAWVALAAPKAGFINVLAHQGLGKSTPLFDIYSFHGIVFVMALHYTPFAYLAGLGTLRNIDSSLEESSQILGASPLRTGLRMTVPLMWPSIASSLLMIFVLAADNFSVPTMLGTPNGYETIPSALYETLNLSPAQPNRAAAIGTLLLLIATIGTLAQRRILRHSRRYVTVASKGGPRRRVALQGWRLPALALCLLYLACAVVLPYLALILGSLMSFVTSRFSTDLFTLDNYRQALDPKYLDSLGNTMLLCVGTALVTAILAILLSNLIQRRLPRRLAALTDYGVIIPNAMPAMVLAIGLLWAFLALPLHVYGTLWILAIAYLIRYLGYGVRTSSAALVQLSPDLEEAARIQGASPGRSFRDVTLPLMRGTLLSLWTLLFVLFFLEISATILLYSPSTQTLSVVLWNELANANQPTAFAIGVVQTTIIFAVLAVAQRAFGTMRHVMER